MTGPALLLALGLEPSNQDVNAITSGSAFVDSTLSFKHTAQHNQNRTVGDIKG